MRRGEKPRVRLVLGAHRLGRAERARERADRLAQHRLQHLGEERCVHPQQRGGVREHPFGLVGAVGLALAVEVVAEALEHGRKQRRERPQPAHL